MRVSPDLCCCLLLSVSLLLGPHFLAPTPQPPPPPHLSQVPRCIQERRRQEEERHLALYPHTKYKSIKSEDGSYVYLPPELVEHHFQQQERAEAEASLPPFILEVCVFALVCVCVCVCVCARARARVLALVGIRGGVADRSYSHPCFLSRSLSPSHTMHRARSLSEHRL